jgi:hypothetical protein
VTIGFWVMAALFGWGTAQGLAGDDGRSLLLYLAVWTAVVFVSILIHELGHALAFASCGQASRIVLYHFGGLTVPVGLPARSLQQPSRQLAVSVRLLSWHLLALSSWLSLVLAIDCQRARRCSACP